MVKIYKTKLPKDIKVKKITSHIEDDNLITMIDYNVSFTPQEGDFIYYKKDQKNSGIFVFSKPYKDDIWGCHCAIEFTSSVGYIITPYKEDRFISKDFCRPAKEKEKLSFLHILEKDLNLRWNENKKILEDIIYPQKGDFLIDNQNNIVIFKELIPNNVVVAYVGGNLNTNYINIQVNDNWGYIVNFRYASKKEIEDFLELLDKKLHMTWNPQSMRLEYISEHKPSLTFEGKDPQTNYYKFIYEDPQEGKKYYISIDLNNI